MLLQFARLCRHTASETSSKFLFSVTSGSRLATTQAQLAETAQIVPPEILQPLQQIEAQLRLASKIDGRRRLQLSQPDLTVPVPKHEIEPGLHTIDAHVRSLEGTRFCRWLRKSGRTPGRIQSIVGPGDKEPREMMIHMDSRDAAKLVRMYGRIGCQARIVQLRLVHPEASGQVLASLRVKPHRVHANAKTLELENLDFLFCPRDRIVFVDVPIKLVNDDVAPGIKKGGWMFISKRTVCYKALGSAVPPFIELDVKQLDLEQELRVRDLPIPKGTKLANQDWDASVVRCTTDIGKD